MAEVGVLNLTIHDNSEEAGRGLKDLADALSAVKTAKQNFSLQGVNTQISNIVNSVKENSKVIGELGKLFNGLAQFGKIKNLNIPVDQFSALKEAINGMTIGQTGTQIENIRKALAGDWKTENMNSMMSSMNALQTAAAGWQASGTAKSITDVANAIEKYTKAYNKMPPESPFTLVVGQLQSQASSMMESANTIRVGIEKASGETANLFGDIIKKHAAGGSGAADEAEKLGNNYSAGFGIGISQGVDAVISACVEIVNAAVQTVRNKAEIHSPSHVTEELGEQTAAGYAEGIRAGTGDVKAAAQEMVQAVTDTTKGITNIDGPFVTVQERIDTIKQSSDAVKEVSKQATDNMAKMGNAIEEIDYSKVNIQDYIATPLEYVADKCRMAGSAVNDYCNQIHASIPVFREYRDSVIGLESKKDIAGFSKKSGEELLEAAKIAQEGSSKMTETMEETQNATESVGETLQRVIPLVDAFGRKMNTSLPMITQDGTVIPAMTEPQTQPQTASVANQIREIRDAAPSIEEVKGNIDELVSSLSAAQATNMSKAFSIEEQIQQFSDLENNMRQVLAADQMAGMVNEQEMARRVVAIRMVHLEQEKLYDQLIKIKEESSGISEIRDSFVSIKGAVKNLLSPLARVAKQFANIARRMAIRAVIRQFTQGIKTGLENVYNYSKAIKSQFATSMDDAASSLLTMKNSLGAALAPALQALIPILQTVVNWFINMMNYVNQFIALINGQNSWIKAVPATTTAFGKEEKAAKKAGNAIKDLLADWDELNIIQSETGGSGKGTGTDAAEEALKMFETMTTFDREVQDVFNTIKENFNEILGLAGDVGLAILSWKVATGLTGILSTLAYIVGAGALIVIEFKISEFLNRKFFETGEDGYLIASALTALVGGFFMKGMLKNVLDGQLTQLTIPLSLLVDATARTLVELGETDVSALSREAIKANIVSALEVGGAAAYLTYTSGFALGQSIAGGAAVAITTFGVLTNLKADVDAVRNNAISEETIKAKALGSLLVSIGAATAAKLLVPGATMGQVMGFGVATGASLFLLTLSATLAITATAEAAKSGITMNTLYSDLGASLSAAVGSALVLKMVTNNSWQLVSKAGAGIGLVVASALIGIQATTQAVRNGKITTDTIIQDAIASLGMGAGIAIIAGTIGKKTLTSALGIGGAGALITLGALIGIQAAVQAAKNGEVTKDTIIAYATSSLAVGAGVAILGATIGGLGTGIAVLGGGLAALAMFGALFAVQAILRPAAKDTIQWGDRKLTEQEVQDYVNTQIFDVNLPVAINLVKGKMEDANAAQSKLKNKIADVQPVVNKLILGFDIPGSLKELDDEIFGENGLLASYNETIKGKKAEIEAALVLVPIKDDQGNDLSAEYLKGISAGWTNIDTIMSNLGKSLADTMKDAYTGQLKENLSDMERQSITEITKTMLEIATIISSSEAEIKMKREFSQGLAGVSGSSIEEIIKYYKSQKDSAKKTMEDVYNVYLDDLAAQKMANEKLLELAEKNGGEYAGQSVEYYKGEIKRINELYEGLIETRDNSIQLALEFYTNGEGLEQVRKAIIDALSNQELNWTYTGNTEDLNGVLSMIMQQAESGSTAMFGSMITYFRNVIKESVTNPEALLNAFDLGLVGFQDIFSDKEIDKIYDMFADMFGEDEQNQEAYGRVRMALDRMFGRTPADAWEDIELYIEDMLDGKWGESDIDEQIREVMDTLKRMYGDDYLRKIFSEYSENFSDISDEFTKWLQDNGYTLTIEVAVDESSAKDAEQRLNEITAGTGAENTVTRGFFRANAINANNAYVVSGVSGSVEGDMSDDVEKGTRAANAEIESKINVLIQLLRLNLNRGNNTVTFVPTSAMGRGVTESLTAWGNVTGD